MKIGYGKDFCGAKKSLNASNVETGARIKTTNQKKKTLAPQDKSALENLYSKSSSQQTNDGGQRSWTGSAMSWRNK